MPLNTLLIVGIAIFLQSPYRFGIVLVYIISEFNKKQNIMKHTIEVIDFEKKGSHTWLIYKADGKTINVTGEFYIDKEGLWYHTHEFEDGTEMEFTF